MEDNCDDLSISRYNKKENNSSLYSCHDANVFISDIMVNSDSAQEMARIPTKKCIFCSNSATIAATINRKYSLPLHLKEINQIVFDEKVHIVSVFKDYLIFDDSVDYFKKLYSYKEATEKMSMLTQKIYNTDPNYFVLEEKKYMIKLRKLKIRLQKEKLENYAQNRKKNLAHRDESIDNAFDTVFYEELNRSQPSISKMKFDELLSYFVEKDSQTDMTSTSCNEFENYKIVIPLTIKLNLCQEVIDHPLHTNSNKVVQQTKYSRTLNNKSNLRCAKKPIEKPQLSTSKLHAARIVATRQIVKLPHPPKVNDIPKQIIKARYSNRTPLKKCDNARSESILKKCSIK